MVIHNDGVPEDELRAFAPRDVGIYTARFQSPRKRGHEYRDDVVQGFVDSPDLIRAAEMLGSMPLDHIGIAYVSGCLLAGLGWDDAVSARVTASAGGVPCVGAATAILAACGALALRSPLMVLPPWFGDRLVEAAAAFGADRGLRPDAVLRTDMGSEWTELEPYEIYDRGGNWRQEPAKIASSIARSMPSGADGVVVLGAGLHAMVLIEELERRLSRPVVTPQQALLWYCLRSHGLADVYDGRGELLRRPLLQDSIQEDSTQ